jgi:hypothetical protein
MGSDPRQGGSQTQRHGKVNHNSQKAVTIQAIPHFARIAGIPRFHERITLVKIKYNRIARKSSQFLKLNWVAIEGGQDFPAAGSQQAFGHFGAQPGRLSHRGGPLIP